MKETDRISATSCISDMTNIVEKIQYNVNVTYESNQQENILNVFNCIG